MFVCLCGGGLFIYYVNSCSFFADFSIKSFSQKTLKTFILSLKIDTQLLKHGGRAFYIHVHDNWNYKVKSDTDDPPYWEEFLVEITDPTNTKSKFNVLNLYRHMSVLLT